MHVGSIVPWIWAIVIGIVIINSFRKKAAAGGAVPDTGADDRAAEAELRKQAYLAMVARQRSAMQTPVPVARTSGADARAAAPAIPAPAARPSAPAQVAAPVAPAPPSAPASPVPHQSLGSRRAGAFRGMFASKKSILRAMVAAEVLGRPKALADQPYWSSRAGGR